MSYVRASDIGCGIYELAGLDTLFDDDEAANLDLKDLARAFLASNMIGSGPIRSSGYVILFSDNIKLKNGQRLAAGLRKKRLGSVRKLIGFNNPNTRHNCEIWAWRPNAVFLDIVKQEYKTYRRERWGL